MHRRTARTQVPVDDASEQCAAVCCELDVDNADAPTDAVADIGCDDADLVPFRRLSLPTSLTVARVHDRPKGAERRILARARAHARERSFLEHLASFICVLDSGAVLIAGFDMRGSLLAERPSIHRPTILIDGTMECYMVLQRTTGRAWIVRIALRSQPHLVPPASVGRAVRRKPGVPHVR
jgi:hypothetical protein